MDPPEKKAARQATKLTEEEKKVYPLCELGVRFFNKHFKKIHHYEEIVNKVQEEVNPEHLEQTKGDAVTVRALHDLAHHVNSHHVYI